MKLFIAFYNNIRSSLTTLGIFGEILAMLIAILFIPFILLFAFFQKTFYFLLLFIYELNHYSANTYLHLKNAFLKLKYIRKIVWRFNDKLITNFILNDSSKQNPKPQNPKICFWEQLLKAILNFIYNIIILIVFITLILICIYGLLLLFKTTLSYFGLNFQIPFISYLKNSNNWILFIETRLFIVASILLIVIIRFIRLKKKYPTLSFDSLYTMQSLFWTDYEHASFQDIVSLYSDKSKKGRKIFYFLSKDPINIIKKSEINKLLQDKYKLTFLQVVEALKSSANIEELKKYIKKLEKDDKFSFSFPQFDKIGFIKEFELLKESLKN